MPGEYATIQAAIDASSDGDEVVIAPGTYTGDGNRDIDFKGKAITVRSTNPDDPAVVAATVIDCQGTWAEHHRGFVFQSNESPDSRLTGLTVVHGYACDVVPAGQHNYKFRGGGAILCVASNPVITRCVLSDNSACTGGAVYCDGPSTPTIANCAIIANLAIDSGGGVVCDGSNAIITGCTVAANTATATGRGSGAGGGIRCLQGSPLISNCAILANVGAFQGGGVAFINGTSIVRNCLIAGNLLRGASGTWSPGGGIALSGTNVVVENCTIAGNTVEKLGATGACGGGIACDVWCTLSVAGCVLWDNSSPSGPQLAVRRSSIATILWSDIRDGVGAVNVEGSTLHWGPGNIDADPLFVDPDGPDDDPAAWQDNDYHLSAGSPCINAGDPAGEHTGQSDIDADPRVAYGRVDVGADEFVYRGPIDFDRGNDVDLVDFGFFAACSAGPNHPWPNVSICAQADLNNDGDVDLEDFQIFQACFNGPNRSPSCR